MAMQTSDLDAAKGSPSITARVVSASSVARLVACLRASFLQGRSWLRTAMKAPQQVMMD